MKIINNLINYLNKNNFKKEASFIKKIADEGKILSDKSDGELMTIKQIISTFG